MTFAMVTIYRKTAKGIAEIETRAHKLTPRLRSALILVDGKRSDADLRALILQQPDETLASLAADGFIELLAVVDTKRAAEPAPPSSARPAAAPPAPAPAAAADIAARRREAVRLIGELLGPMGDSLSMKIERAKTADELRTLLEQALPVIAGARGRDKAAEFAARFSDL